MKRLIAVCVMVVLFAPAVFAEKIVLKDGKIVEGKIVEETESYIKIDVEGTPLTYFKTEIIAVRRDDADSSPAGEEGEKPAKLEILNTEYTKPPNPDDNVEINSESAIPEIMKKVNYYYSTHDFDKAIELCKLALTKTDDRFTIALINYSLSANYLEKGIKPYTETKDDTFYKLSIESAKKCLEVIPDSWQSLANIGAVYLNMGQAKEAVFYYTQAQKYLDKNSPIYQEIELTRQLAEKMSSGAQAK